MKLHIKNTILLAAAVVGLTACNPDTDPKLNVQSFVDNPPLLSLGECDYLSGSTYDFATPYAVIDAMPEETAEEAEAKAQILNGFTGAPVKFNIQHQTDVPLAVAYSLRACNVADFDAEDAKIEDLGNFTTLAEPVSVTVSQLNNLAMKYAGEDITAGTKLYLRVEALLNDGFIRADGSNPTRIAAVGQPVEITVVPFKVEVEYPCIWFIGKAEGWDIAGKDEFRLFDYTGTGVYEGTFTLSDGTDNYFRFYTQVGDWESNSLGYQEPDQGTDITAEMKNGVYTGNMVNGKGSWCITTNGTYKMTVDVPNMKVRFEAVNGDEDPDLDPSLWKYIYIIGKPQGWKIDSDALTIVDRKGNGIYTGTITLSDGNDNYFRFYRALGDWESNSIGYQVPDEGTDITGLFVDGVYEGAAVEGKGSWLITTDGTYGIEFNDNDMTVKFTAQ